MKINIPQIYEENIIEFLQKDGNIVYKYMDEKRVFQITFVKVYQFDFTEFDYITEVEWNFGLEMEAESDYINVLLQNMPEEKKQRAFGGEITSLYHYKLAIDDVGIYNIICKGIETTYV